MTGHSISRNLRKGTQLIRKKGLRALLNPIRAYIEFADVSQHLAVMKTLEMTDYSYADLLQNKELMNRFKEMKNVPIGTVNWFIPLFEHPFAGVFTILRIADFLHSAKGIENRFIFYGEGNSLQKLGDEISRHFPSLSSVQMYLINEGKIDALPYADVGIATRWDSAPLLLKFNKTKGKFYLIQDFEPLFYPASSSYAAAERTYTFGFFGIVNTPGLRDIYTTDYHGTAEYFVPAVDAKVFFPSDRDVVKPSVERPFTVFFYARPNVQRNGFELGIAALKKIKTKYGERVKIYAAGTNWNPQDYGLKNVLTVLGTLPYEETASLYRKCDLGIVFMFTKHPSYLPFELMACGCPIVTNKNPANAWFLKDEQNCLLSEPTISCVCEKIELAIADVELRKRLRLNGANSVGESTWESQIEKIYKFVSRS